MAKLFVITEQEEVFTENLENYSQNRMRNGSEPKEVAFLLSF